MSFIDEEDLENFSIEWFKEIGYQFVHGPNIAPEKDYQERDDLRINSLHYYTTREYKKGVSDIQGRKELHQNSPWQG